MTRSPNRILAVIFGAGYILVGLLGFAVTGSIDFFAIDGGLLFGIFEVNNFHNVAHLLIGSALLIAGLATIPAARAVGREAPRPSAAMPGEAAARRRNRSSSRSPRAPAT